MRELRSKYMLLQESICVYIYIYIYIGLHVCVIAVIAVKEQRKSLNKSEQFVLRRLTGSSQTMGTLSTLNP